MARSTICLFAVLAAYVVHAIPQYKVPDAKLEAIWPKGLRVTVPGMLNINFVFYLM